MGYSQHIDTLIAMLPDLEMLAQGKQCIWTVRPGETSTYFAYKVREALYIAELYPDRYPSLVEARRRFTIEIVSSTQVQARLRRAVGAAKIEALGSPQGVVTHGLENAGMSRRTMGPQTATSIIQTWLDAQPTNDKFYFPDAHLSHDEKLKLLQWATNQKLIFLVNDQGGLTLTKESRDMAGLSWSPEDQ